MLVVEETHSDSFVEYHSLQHRKRFPFKNILLSILAIVGVLLYVGSIIGILYWTESYFPVPVEADVFGSFSEVRAFHHLEMLYNISVRNDEHEGVGIVPFGRKSDQVFDYIISEVERIALHGKITFEVVDEKFDERPDSLQHDSLVFLYDYVRTVFVRYDPNPEGDTGDELLFLTSFATFHIPGASILSGPAWTLEIIEALSTSQDVSKVPIIFAFSETQFGTIFAMRTNPIYREIKNFILLDTRGGFGTLGLAFCNNINLAYDYGKSDYVYTTSSMFSSLRRKFRFTSLTNVSENRYGMQFSQQGNIYVQNTAIDTINRYPAGSLQLGGDMLFSFLLSLSANNEPISFEENIVFFDVLGLFFWVYRSNSAWIGIIIFAILFLAGNAYMIKVSNFSLLLPGLAAIAFSSLTFSLGVLFSGFGSSVMILFNRFLWYGNPVWGFFVFALLCVAGQILGQLVTPIGLKMLNFKYKPNIVKSLSILGVIASSLIFCIFDQILGIGFTWIVLIYFTFAVIAMIISLVARKRQERTPKWSVFYPIWLYVYHLVMSSVLLRIFIRLAPYFGFQHKDSQYVEFLYASLLSVFTIFLTFPVTTVLHTIKNKWKLFFFILVCALLLLIIPSAVLSPFNEAMPKKLIITHYYNIDTNSSALIIDGIVQGYSIDNEYMSKKYRKEECQFYSLNYFLKDSTCWINVPNPSVELPVVIINSSVSENHTLIVDIEINSPTSYSWLLFFNGTLKDWNLDSPIIEYPTNRTSLIVSNSGMHMIKKSGRDTKTNIKLELYDVFSLIEFELVTNYNVGSELLDSVYDHLTDSQTTFSDSWMVGPVAAAMKKYVQIHH